jgi:hypothetical protein
MYCYEVNYKKTTTVNIKKVKSSQDVSLQRAEITPYSPFMYDGKHKKDLLRK